MLERVLVAGSGGQGIVLMGRILAAAAISSFKHLTFFPSYGAEVRGGTSSCQVVLSSKEIASPLTEDFDSMIMMNQESIKAYSRQARRTSFLVLNSSLCKLSGNHGTIAKINATAMAERLGDIRTANFIMLGAYIAQTSIVPSPAVEKAMEEAIGKKGRAILDLNLKAFRAGLNS